LHQAAELLRRRDEEVLRLLALGRGTRGGDLLPDLVDLLLQLALHLRVDLVGTGGREVRRDVGVPAGDSVVAGLRRSLAGPDDETGGIAVGARVAVVARARRIGQRRVHASRRGVARVGRAGIRIVAVGPGLLAAAAHARGLTPRTALEGI